MLQHAQATELRVSTGEEAQGVFVMLQDNGTGFAARPSSDTGRGLSNIVRRARAIGGQVSWEAVDCGTCLVGIA